MDIYCPKCAEPWDHDSLHDLDEDGIGYDAMSKRFRQEGCKAFGTTCNEQVDELRARAMSELFDMLGDDMDGAASMMDDFEFLGMLD